MHAIDADQQRALERVGGQGRSMIREVEKRCSPEKTALGW
jgi:hypothetical protein